jgi:hypothetical protein
MVAKKEMLGGPLCTRLEYNVRVTVISTIHGMGIQPVNCEILNSNFEISKRKASATVTYTCTMMSIYIYIYITKTDTSTVVFAGVFLEQPSKSINYIAKLEKNNKHKHSSGTGLFQRVVAQWAL